MQKTANYQLNQYEPGDAIKREDFNADNRAIDTALAGHDTALAAKADVSALNSTNAAVIANTAAIAKKAEQTALDATNTALAVKAAQTDLNTTNTQLAALASALGSGGQNCRIVWGSYTGTGTYGKANPTKLEVGFYPTIAIMGCKDNVDRNTWPTTLLRGIDAGVCDLSTSNKMTVQWADTSVSYYSEIGNYAQNNSSGSVYYFVVLGHDKAA